MSKATDDDAKGAGEPDDQGRDLVMKMVGFRTAAWADSTGPRALIAVHGVNQRGGLPCVIVLARLFVDVVSAALSSVRCFFLCVCLAVADGARFQGAQRGHGPLLRAAR